MTSVATYLRLVKFSHSVFALPFALSAAWLASGGLPELRTLGLILLCTVAARTAAMAFNRVVDRGIDAANPRTAKREIAAGVVSPLQGALLAAAAAAAFIAGAFALNPLCGALSFPVLAVLFGYSYAKRVTWFAHVALGVALGIAPLGAWLAVTGDLSSGIAAPLVLALSVTTWVAGFDLIYACQDAEFDRRHALHSIPARFGVPRALVVSKLLHVVTATSLAAFGRAAGLGWVYWAALAVVLVLLAWQHGLVSADDFSRVDVAFFTMNGWVGVLLFVGVAADLGLQQGP